MNEITRGLADQGSYHLHMQFLKLVEKDEADNPQFLCVRPDEMVNHIRTKDSMVATTANVVFPQMQPDMSQPEIFKAPSNFTQLERARIIVQSGKISFDPKLHIFNVLGSGDRPCVVRLFPKVLCSCPSTGLCCHIVAVKISIGSEMKVSQIQKLDLTLFRKRCKSRKDKTSGRKRPREKDIDSNPSEAFENKINIKSNHDDTLEIECPQKFSLPTISSSEERMPVFFSPIMSYLNKSCFPQQIHVIQLSIPVRKLFQIAC